MVYVGHLLTLPNKSWETTLKWIWGNFKIPRNFLKCSGLGFLKWISGLSEELSNPYILDMITCRQYSNFLMLKYGGGNFRKCHLLGTIIILKFNTKLLWSFRLHYFKFKVNVSAPLRKRNKNLKRIVFSLSLLSFDEWLHLSAIFTTSNNHFLINWLKINSIHETSFLFSDKHCN